MTTKDGVELLIHVGINTVMLEGEGFETLVDEGAQVKAGQPLLRFEPSFIQEKGYLLTSPVLVTNADDFQKIECPVSGQIKTGEFIYRVIK